MRWFQATRRSPCNFSPCHISFLHSLLSSLSEIIFGHVPSLEWKHLSRDVIYLVHISVLSTSCYWIKLGSTHSCTVKPIYWHQIVVKEGGAFIAGHQARSPGRLVLKTPELLGKLQQSFLKGKVREGITRLCDQLLYNSLTGWWWGNWAVSQM